MIKNYIKKLPEVFLIPIEYFFNKLIKDHIKSEKYLSIYNDTIEEIKFIENIKNKEELEKYKFDKLKQILIYANDNVKYYEDLFRNINFVPKDMKNLSEITKIPFLNKEIINKNYKDLISKQYKNNKKFLIKLKTGGSTGKPLEFLADNLYFKAREDAFIDYIFKSAGYSKNYKTIILRGDLVKKIEKKVLKNVYWRKKYGTNELIMSSYDLNGKTCKYYIDKIINYIPECIKAYPSALELLAKEMKKNNIKISSVKLIILASENFNNNQKELFEEIFPNSKLFSFYGHTEQACLAVSMKNCDFYKFEPTYGYTEFIENEYDSYEIVCTGYNNYVMPFIRYKTGDLVTEVNSNLFDITPYIEGREKEYIIDKFGEKIVFTGAYKILDCVKTKILSGQLIQEEKGIINVNLITEKNFNKNDLNLIKEAFNEKYQNKIEIKINKVSELYKTNRGKTNFFVQRIK